MSNQKTLFNYDKNLRKILKSSKLLMIDLDGTIIDFEKIDHIIIKELFPSSRAISFIDNLLWTINRLDIFGNGYAGHLIFAFILLFQNQSLFNLLQTVIYKYLLLGLLIISLIILILANIKRKDYSK